MIYSRDDIYLEFLKSNSKIVEKYLEERLYLFQKCVTQLDEEEKAFVIKSFIEQDGTVMKEILQAQMTSAVSLFNIDISNNKTPMIDETNESYNKNIVSDKVDQALLGDDTSVGLVQPYDMEEMKTWLKEQISEHTGFPIERIKDDTNFEEDLGLVSIDMVKIYSKLVERFPGTGKNVEVIIGVSNIQELLDAVVVNSG